MPRCIALVVFALCAVLPLRGQTPSSTDSPHQPVFRAGTTLVEVSAIVTSDGVPVIDLTADEVQILDEGRPQPLVSFEFIDLTTVEGPPQRRDFVLVIDDRHIAPNRTMAARDVAQSFIGALGPHDRLAIVNTGSKELVQQLSTDRRASEALVRRVQGERLGRMAVEVEAYARLTFAVLRNVASVLQREGATERRAVVFVSEGHILPEGPTGNEFPEVRAAYRDVLREAALANVAIYTIDVRGLVAFMPGGPPRVGQVMDARSLPRVHGNEPATLPAESRMAEALAAALADRRFGSLGSLASHTGGVLTVDTNELGRDIPRILRESRQYYRLVYAQPDVDPDEGEPLTRRIEVKVSRPGVQVRARQQYVPR